MDEETVYNILLFNDGKFTDAHSLLEELEAELRKKPEISLSVAKNLKELEELFKNGHLIHLLFLVIPEEPSEPLFDLISMNRNMVRLRDTHFVSLHGHGSSSGIQKALMLGVKTIFLEPIQRKQITSTLLNLLENNRSYKVVPSTLGESAQNLSLLPCRITAFGRIGKIFQHPVGDLQIETDLNLSSGATIELRSKLADDHGQPTFHYTVSSATDQDTYYHYRHSYQLSWKADPILKEKLATWINHNQSLFAIPKTKVLWVTDSPQESIEGIFNKTLFSLHTQAPGRLSEGYLSRLNPRIIVTDEIPELPKKVIADWFHLSSNHDRLFIQTSPKALLPWHFISKESPAQFKEAFLKLVKPYLLKRVSSSVKQAKYFSRGSNYSRCAFSFPGTLIPLSQSHMALDIQMAIEENTILFVQCPSLEDPRKLGLYLKVLKSESVLAPPYTRQICEIIPISDEPNPSITPFLPGSVNPEKAPAIQQEAEVREKTPEPLRVASPAPYSEDLYFLKTRRSPVNARQVFATLLFLLGIAFFVFQLTAKNAKRSFDPEPPGITNMERALRAIRNAFR